MKNSNQDITRFAFVAGLILLAALTRLLPHPANLTAIMAIALFGGAKFTDRRVAIVLPLIMMLLTDLIIGFYSLMPVVYSCIVVTTLAGIYVGKKNKVAYIIGGSLFSSILFFLCTNTAVWYHDPKYSQDFAGLMLCLEAGIPFFKNQVFGDLFFNGVLFGTYKLATRRFPKLALQS